MPLKCLGEKMAQSYASTAISPYCTRTRTHTHTHTQIPFLFTETTFRGHLVSMETEVEELRRTVGELKQQNKGKDKANAEIKRLKSIVTAQDQKVCTYAQMQGQTRWPPIRGCALLHAMWTQC